jgi:Protein of unknown function (DUF3574)
MLNFLATVLIASSCLARDLNAEGAAGLQPEMVKSEIYFGSDAGGGQSVTDQDWQEFLSSVIRVRLMTGFTVFEGFGRGARVAGPLTRTRVLVVVHPTGTDAEARLHDIKVEYTKRFGSAGIFQVDGPVQVRSD